MFSGNSKYVSNISGLKAAMLDINSGLISWRIWTMLAWQDLKLRYRRSMLGPFWITLSMAITVYSMGYLYAFLFHMPVERYLPYLAAGMLAWNLVSTILIESTDVFAAVDQYMKQIRLPYTLYVHRMVWRNFLIFGHNLFIMIPLYILYPKYAHLSFQFLMFLPGFLIVYINSFTYGVLIGFLGARYRDIQQIIKTLIQVLFFITPVMWDPNMIKGKFILFANLNPLYVVLELVRDPILGIPMHLHVLYMSFAVTLLGIIGFFIIFLKFRKRLIYWV